MDNGATGRETLEDKLEKNLQDPNAEPMYLPLEFLKVITGDFSTERELGRGAYGVVYKGVLQSGKVIAVKKIFDAHLLDNNNKFENEITCLRGVRHQNVVQLVGYCVQTRKEVMMLPSGEHVMVEIPVCLLCFEFHCKGSLDKYVSDFLVLGWDMRYQIIRGVCSGLHYLHDKCHIVHLDLKPQNVLMDAMMIPKIADFGLSRILGDQKSKTVTTNFAGTPGYMAQEYIDHGIISPKADIFSLGVIIIEIITGDRVYPNISGRTETSSVKHFTEEVVGSWRKRLELTPMHMSSEMHIQQVEQCISIALKCLEPDSNERPTSMYIVRSLNAEETKSRSLENSTSLVEKDRRNQIRSINDLNECAHLFHWVISATSSLKSKCSGTQLEKLQGDARQLQSDLQCLSDTLPATYNLIDRAEWKIHHDSVADLLSRLKDAVYDAEDLLDEFRWYEKKVSVEGNAISMEPVIKFLQSVTQGSFNKVTGIQKRLNHLSGQLEKTGLLQAIPRFDKSFRPETTAFPIEPDVFGRDKEKEKLIRMLGVLTDNSTDPSERKRKRNAVCSSTSNQICATSNEETITNVPVLPIVGIGGVGKTTLAQDICNHSKVKSHFHLIIWICVSDDFDVKRLTKEAIEQSSREVPKNDNLNSLQVALADGLKEKTFLLVLDDMWNENELDWKRFCAPFRNVLQGSMMLVTTRSPIVADVVRTMDPFPLEGLNKDVFRKFFKLCVFGSDSSDIDPELERIAEKMLPKLRGSPLAAKTLGRLLGKSLDPAHWDRILKSQLWELQQKETDILPALRLSYMYLPFYLRRCFSFCAVYPKDHKFKKEDLVEIWVAEGFVEHQPNVSLQHIGGQYFEELAHLSFFQRHPWVYHKHIMHDLIHDMAQLVSKDECCVIKDTKDFRRIPQSVLHLLVLDGGDVKCSDLINLCKHRKLRTLLCDISLKSETGNTMMEKWCAELLCMRVLVCSSISKWGLPGSISNMKHLRYLKILDSCPCNKLPAAFCRLYNMQIFYAEKWKIDDIPSGFGMLINLRKFESVKCQFHHGHSVDRCEGATTYTGKFKFQNYGGESLPSWFHPQNSMQIHSYDSTCSTFLPLTDVVIDSCQNLACLKQFLQPAYVPVIKEIEISYCGSLESVPVERFGDLRFLEVLRVSHCPMIKSQHIFAPSLKKLYLEDSGNLGYKIECSSLIILHLSSCPLESIELQLWNLPLLQELEISSCSSLTVIRDSEPLSSDILHGEANNTFLSPNDVETIDCQKLSSQEQFLQPVYMPIVKKIKISNCRSLESVPTMRFGYFHFLEVLSVFCCPKIKSGQLFAPSLKKLYLKDSGDLGYKIKCSSLTMLHLSNCPLEYIDMQICRDSESISSDIFNGEARSRIIDSTFLPLTDVVIDSCQNLTSLEQFLQPAYVLIIKEIEISHCGSLESVPAERFGALRFLEVLRVSHCPMIKSQHMFAPSLKKLYLEDPGNLKYNIDCSSLTMLHFSDSYLESIELQMWNLPLLQELNITFCSSLTIIRDSELVSTGGATNRMGKFPKLAHLTIMNCDRLESIDDLLHLPAIERIYIMRSGLLSLPANRLRSFPLLKDLDISFCPSLNWQSGMLLPSSLQKLTLWSCGDFSAWFPCCLENLTSLESLQIIDCECIVSVPGHLWSSKLKSLQSLKFLSCLKLKSIGGSDAIAHIRDLCIADCPELEEIDQP